MKSNESAVAAQVRLSQWAQEIQDCLNRPKNMTIDEWCRQHNIKKASYYWRLKRVRQACLEKMEPSAGNFIELPMPTQCAVPALSDNAPVNQNPSIVAIIRSAGGISVEITEMASSEFMQNLIGALANA